jgi:hypothetical protein
LVHHVRTTNKKNQNLFLGIYFFSFLLEGLFETFFEEMSRIAELEDILQVLEDGKKRRQREDAELEQQYAKQAEILKKLEEDKKRRKVINDKEEKEWAVRALAKFDVMAQQKIDKKRTSLSQTIADLEAKRLVIASMIENDEAGQQQSDHEDSDNHDNESPPDIDLASSPPVSNKSLPLVEVTRIDQNGKETTFVNGVLVSKARSLTAHKPTAVVKPVAATAEQGGRGASNVKKPSLKPISTKK